MKIIFLANVKGQGKKDEIKEVKDGYAKFLISTNQAVAYTNKSLEVLNTQIKDRNDEEQARIDDANKVKTKLSKVTLEFIVKTGAQDKLFGSISSKQISEALESKGFNVDKKNIKIESELNTLGTHTVIIELHKKVKCEVSVVLKK